MSSSKQVRDPILRDLVLVGGGHSHVQVLRRLAMEPLPDTRLTVILDLPIAIYSGMVPGFVAGQYTAEELEIDVVPLARRAGARVILSPAISIDAEARKIHLKDRPPLRYDAASIDIGSTVAGLDAPGVRQYALPTRPISRLVAQLDTFLERHANSSARTLQVAVVGAGAGGVELAFTLEQRLNHLLKRPAEVHLLTSDSRILRGYPDSLVRRLHAEAEGRGIRITCDRRVQAVEAERVVFKGGGEMACDAVVWVTGATSHGVFRDSDLPTDARGFVSTRSTLQVQGFDDLFAVGDCATLIEHPETPKAGVYAVRQGPYLVENLRAFLAGQPLKKYRPQSDFLTLLNLGDGTALGSKKGLTFGGHWVMRLKDWIDRRFMEKFQVLESSGAMTEAFRALPEMEGDAMLCGGCAAKVGQPVLERALARLEQPAGDDALLLGPGDDAAAFRSPKGEVMVSTIDAFRAFTDDPYLVGEVAAINAVSDLLAKGVAPRFYQALVVLPEDEPAEIVEETLYQVMAGMRAALDPLGATLLGGHTSTAPNLMVGLTVEGWADSAAELLVLERLKAGQRLILTKPLGTGVLFHADMQGKARGPWVESGLNSMRRANSVAASIARQVDASAATDITGFGLVGHLGEMLRASGHGAVIDVAALPALPGSVELLRLGLRSTFHPENARARQGIAIDASAARHEKLDLLFDPQTSGGLLIAVPKSRANEALALLHKGGDLDAAIIGQVGSRREDGVMIEVIAGQVAGSGGGA